MLCSCTNVVLANEKLSKQNSISERLKALRARLDNFQKGTKIATKTNDVLETVELKLKPIKINFETLSSNIETRKDVKMITLFHDPEFDVVVKPDLSIKKRPITIDDLRQKFKKGR